MAEIQLGEKATCETCETPVVGARASVTGEVRSIHLLPSPDGTALLWRDHTNGEPVFVDVLDDAAVLYLRDDLRVPLRILAHRQSEPSPVEES